MNLPNILSIFRMCLVPVFIAVFFSGHEYAHPIAACVYALAGITDVLDGIIARKFDLITKLGKVLDPLADKMMTITVFVCITSIGLIPWWTIALLFAKDALLMFEGLIPPICKTIFAITAIVLSFTAFFSYLYQYCKYRKTHEKTSTEK